MSIKSTIKSFIEPKNIYTLYSSSSSNAHSPSHTIDSFNISIQLNHIAKMIEECVYAFTKRYLIVSTELEEMKREFIGQSSTINEYLQLTKKEIRLISLISLIKENIIYQFHNVQYMNKNV